MRRRKRRRRRRKRRRRRRSAQSKLDDVGSSEALPENTWHRTH
jgi:hypothetical protein